MWAKDVTPVCYLRFRQAPALPACGLVVLASDDGRPQGDEAPRLEVGETHTTFLT